MITFITSMELPLGYIKQHAEELYAKSNAMKTVLIHPCLRCEKETIKHADNLLVIGETTNAIVYDYNELLLLRLMRKSKLGTLELHNLYRDEKGNIKVQIPEMIVDQFRSIEFSEDIINGFFGGRAVELFSSGVNRCEEL